MLRGTARQASGRGVVLLPAAALLVHQLRYWLSYGGQAGNELADTGHAYLATSVPWIVMLTAAGVATFAIRRRVAAQRSLAERWAGASAALLTLFVLQETLEGLFATGHPGGVAGVLGHGGWWAIPLALAVGLLLALVLRVADRIARSPSRPPVLRGAATLLFPDTVGPLRARPLATAAAGRAPPRSPRSL
ncbi:MAG TPA: hypothetical protein VGU02_10750 [Gaiellaceae bacterium]|nr:hypothetical protein [Gaiellaceae bacterium]